MSYFDFKGRDTNARQEVVAGITTFLSMVYSVALIPSLLSNGGFNTSSVFVATCLAAGLGSIALGLYANLPLAIGMGIPLAAYLAFNLANDMGIPIPVIMGSMFIMGILFVIISVSGLRTWVIKNFPHDIAIGTGIGIGLFLFLIATSNVKLVVTNPHGLPVKMGDFTSFPVLMSLLGLAIIVALEKLKIPGSILWAIVGITILGVIFDPKIKYQGIFEIPKFDSSWHFFDMDIKGALTAQTIPILFALLIPILFNATASIRAVTEQAKIHSDNLNNRALIADSGATVLAGLFGTAPAAVYIESAAGVAVGGRTGLTAVVAGIGFLLTIFFKPLIFLVPDYATAPALMYVGLLMLSNIGKLDFNSDYVSAMSALISAVFVVLTANIVTGLMIGFVSLVIGRLVTRDFARLTISNVVIATGLFLFYYFGFAY